MKNTTITIMKGICMLLVVAGHAGCPFTRFIYLFHMPVFFMISGYLFKEKYFSNVHNLSLLLHKRILRFWLPYVISNVFFLLLSGVSINKDFFFKLFKILLFCYEAPLGDASWFLGTLFSVTLLYACISYILRSLDNKSMFTIQFLIAAGLLYFSFFCQQQGTSIKLVVLRVFSVYSIFFLGYLYRRNNIFTKPPYILFSGIIGGIVLFFSQDLNVNLGSNIYTSPLSLMILSITGWHFIYFIATVSEKNSVLTLLFSYIGNHTMPILLSHWLCFSLVAKIYSHFNWWHKTLLGLFIPLIIYMILQKIIRLFFPDNSKSQAH